MTDHVEFAGFLDGDAKIDALHQHDIFINTTRVDNAPVTLLEAAAAALPIVSTDAGGIPVLFRDGDEILLVPIGDARAMADAVERLVAEPGLGARIGARARERAMDASWPRVRERWLELLRRVVAHEFASFLSKRSSTSVSSCAIRVPAFPSP